MWEVMHGREPYEADDAINAAMRVCLKEERPDFLWDLPPGMKELIEQCWDKEAEIRPGFKEIAKKLEMVQRDYMNKMNVNTQWDELPTLKQDNDSDLCMMQKGHAKDVDFMHIELCIYIGDDKSKEITKVPILDRRRVTISIGDVHFVGANIGDILRDGKIIWVESMNMNNTKKKYKIKANSTCHAKWFEQKLWLFKRFAQSRR